MADSYSGYPDSAKKAARRAIKHKEENGTSCGTAVGWTRARTIANGEGMTLSTVKRTYSFLSRSETYNTGSFTDKDGKDVCGSIMYAAWGGSSMRRWCKGVINKADKKRNEMENSNKEVRATVDGLEVRKHTYDHDEKEGRTLTGYAIKFDDITTIGGQFEERVADTALDGVDMSNTFALYNHDWNTPLGRSGKNLSLEMDDTGLRVSLDLPNTTAANDLAELVDTGIVGGMSFGFTVADDQWEDRDGMPLRTINKIDELYEVTFTPIPAYPTTEVGLRSMADALGEDEREALEMLERDITIEEASRDLLAICEETGRTLEDVVNYFSSKLDTDGENDAN